MANISKETYSGVSEKERKENLATIGNVLRKNKNTDKLYTVQKRKAN